MNTDILTVEVDKTIRRPIDNVRRQFGDMRHHEKYHVHPDVQFTVLSEEGNACRFRQAVSVLGMSQVDEVYQLRQPNGDIVSDIVAGTNRGMHIIQSFKPDGEGATAIHFRLDMPISGIKKLLKPLFAAALRKAIVKGLEEDRIDLEQRGYPRSAA